MNDKKNIIIATGGTGGHVFPAVSLANYLSNNGFNLTLTTDQRGLKFVDNKIVNKIKIINSAPLSKKNIFISIFKILIAFFKSFIFLIKTRPKFIFGMGGYASFPICFAGAILKIPFIIYENNLSIGKANRFLANFAKKIFISYEDVYGIKDNHKNKIIVIGNILREKILNNSQVDKIETNNDLNILVLGGSQAAKIFAELLPDIFLECKKNMIDLKIYQQCLDEQKLNLQKKYEKNGINCELFSFTFDILKYYNISNLVITRAGSSALAELLNCKIPIISIPLPSSSENHQLKNAQYFKKKGYGFLVEEKNIKKELFNLLQSIHKDKSILNTIKINQKNHSDMNVFLMIKKEIYKIFYEN